MSATELIRQVAALPPQEKARFLELVHALENGAPPEVPPNGTHWPDFTQRLHEIYGNKVAPDSQSIIDEGRGDLTPDLETWLPEAADKPSTPLTKADFDAIRERIRLHEA